MSLALLPCEIYHREFDAKFILASRLSSQFRIPALIGYDKHFSFLAKHLSRCTLLDKSCSSIMWNSRLRPVLENGGKVIVSDEEGFNNITQANSSTWSSRLDFTAANSINEYCFGVKLTLIFTV